VNLLLIEPAELSRDDTCTVRDRRADHLRSVLGVTVGARVRAGITGGRLGTAEILADDGAAITLRLALTEPPSLPLAVELVLAIPRPKVLSRVIEAAASFAVARILLTNAWRVDKSYLSSPRLAPDALALAARLGAEQGATTHVPEIAVHRRLMTLLDERWPALAAPASPPSASSPSSALPALPALRSSAPSRSSASPALPTSLASLASLASPSARPAALKLIAHPGAPPIEAAVPRAAPVVLAIGPEGGWIEREVETLIARGFTPVSIGAPILRVETAVAAALGQLLVIHRLAER
jgi:16S rRNA U1498 N3-methylase RsmE